MSRWLLLSGLTLLGIPITGIQAACSDGDACWSTLTSRPTILLGHRGDPYYVPEHSIASYAIALEEGLDFIEPDLQMTSDYEVVCSHNLHLSNTTDVADKYPSRSRTLYVDGTVGNLTDWFISDFKWEELQTLTLKQSTSVVPKSARNIAFDGDFKMTRLVDMIDYIHTRTIQLNTTVGIIPEIKHSTYYQVIHKEKGESQWKFEEAVLKILQEKGYDNNGNSPRGPVIIQSAETDNLKYLAEKTKIPLLQLLFDSYSTEGRTGMFFDWMLTPTGLSDISKYAKWVGIQKDFLTTDQSLIWSKSSTSIQGTPFADPKHHRYGTDIKLYGGYLPYNQIIPQAHALGLSISIYTLRNAREDVPAAEMENIVTLANGGVKQGVDMGYQMLLTNFMKMGVDSMFVEKAGAAIYARNARIDKLQRYRDDDSEDRIAYWRRLALGTIIFTLILASCLLYFIWRVSGQKRRLLTQAQQRNENDATAVSLISDTAAHPDSAMVSSALKGRHGSIHRYDQSMDPEEVATDDDTLISRF